MAERVVIVANADDPESLQVARHYARARAVPARNIVALPMPRAETISWREFVATIWNPLFDRLVAEGWIDALATSLTDNVGRKKAVVHRHALAALVTCRGVPLRILHDPELYEAGQPFTRRAEFQLNAGAVDAELTLMAQPAYPINAFVLNPLYEREQPSPELLQQVIRVSRLDGPTAQDAMRLVDQALQAERDGLWGRAYVDLSDRDEVGNGWLRATARQLDELGFDTVVHTAAETMPATERVDAPVFYFGWYAQDATGAFGLPGLRFAPGAVALHIHSYSATSLRSDRGGWTGPLIARGATAAVGNVFEPYLELTHHPHLMLRALARGATLVEAAYYAQRALSWQQILVGDPLYRPFARGLEAQYADRARLPEGAAGYVALRKARLLEAQEDRAGALDLLQAEARLRPHPAVALAIVDRLQGAQEPGAVASGLAAALARVRPQPNTWSLLANAAETAAKLGDHPTALTTWQGLFRDVTIPPGARVLWLRQAAAHAASAHAKALAAAWSAEAAALEAPASAAP